MIDEPNKKEIWIQVMFKKQLTSNSLGDASDKPMGGVVPNDNNNFKNG